MLLSVILAHPDLNSFNHAIAGCVVEELKARGHHVRFHDLYFEKFDPMLPAGEIPRDGSLTADVMQHCRELVEAEGLIIIHPNWWGQPPAILKGWIDRILRPDVAYYFKEDDKGGGIPIGLLKTKAAIIFNTSNTPPRREQAVFHDPLETLWKTCILNFCGIKNIHRRMFNIVVTSTEEERRQWLEEVQETVCKYF